MNDIVTEKVYPVELVWIFKPLAGLLAPLVVLSPLFIFGENFGIVLYYLIYVLIPTTIYIFYGSLRRSTFGYSIEPDFITIRQGIISKQQRHIPYGVIQHTYIKQDLLDRILGICSLLLENASVGGATVSNQSQKVETLGFSGNRVSIPGLSVQNAELLKNIILQKITSHPLEDKQSGL